MPLAVCALSHSPLFGIVDPAGEVLGEINRALDGLRKFVREFEPEVTIVFGPDHFNGLFYDLMPAFCIGTAASAVGDWNTAEGVLPVDRGSAQRIISASLNAGIDVARSERLLVDHGVAQPLELLFGRAAIPPIVPIIINAVGLPLGPMSRARLLGEAVGKEALSWGKRVLLVASGGLSHDPPIPRLEGAPPDVVERLISGRNPAKEVRFARQQGVIDAARAHAAGDSTYKQINQDFDREVLDILASGDLGLFDRWSNDEISDRGGNAAQEIRTWLAAFAALSAADPYQMTERYYWPVKEWVTGFAFACATSRNI